MQDATLVAKSLVAQLIGTSLVFPKETSRVQISAPLYRIIKKKKLKLVYVALQPLFL